MRRIIQNSLREALQTLRGFMEQEANLRELEAVAGQIAGCLKAGNKVLVFGNGGSMADAMHFAEELTGRFRKDRKALPAIALSDPSFLTCVANDYGFDQVFARGVQAYAVPGMWRSEFPPAATRPILSRDWQPPAAPPATPFCFQELPEEPWQEPATTSYWFRPLPQPASRNCTPLSCTLSSSAWNTCYFPRNRP